LVAKTKEVQEASSKRRLPQPEEMPESAAMAKLLPENHLEPLPSVTERTTCTARDYDWSAILVRVGFRLRLGTK